MSKFSTPGQKRKRNIKVILALLVAAIVVGAWYIEGPGQRLAKAAIADPEKVVIDASVAELYQETERYRNFKGKRRTRTNSYVTLTYEFQGETVTETKEISESHYDALEQGDSIELWAVGPNHDLILFKRNILSDANTSPLSRSIQAALFSGIGAVVLSFILIPVFGREPDGYMPEGFYGDSSWLDVEDHQLIGIGENELVRFKFASANVKAVQKAYQDHKPLEELVQIRGKDNKVDVIPLAAIGKVSSRHFDDTYEVSYQVADSKTGEVKSKTMDLEFLNPTVKTHAMESLIKRLPESQDFEKTVTHYSRLKSALPSGIGLLLGLGGLWYFEHWIGLALCGLLALFTFKSFIARLWSPTVLTEYTRPDAPNLEEGNTELKMES